MNFDIPLFDAFMDKIKNVIITIFALKKQFIWK